MKFVAIAFLQLICLSTYAQVGMPHLKAHAHNDYEHARPLFDALQNGFNSVEADVHLKDGVLVVAHNKVTRQSPQLMKLYLSPLDSLLKVNHGSVFSKSTSPFYLMIDIKTDGPETYTAIRKMMTTYPRLKCKSGSCPVKVFLSGERPVSLMMADGYDGLSIDGRPSDLEKGYSLEWMPVISDNYSKWCSWDGKTMPAKNDLRRVRELAERVHAEGRKLRLWAIPDNILAWRELSNAGVDLINTDHLEALNRYLTQRGY
ncbi:MAG TPA: hypothetical protein VG737_08595 [Cyclobacteriaceae bacterium]|nr:hypothetical protein [Cyclobacteriaceae bacterium]